MIITESQLKRIINEEVQKVLFEQEFKEFLLETLTEGQIKLIRTTGQVPEELIEGVMDWLRKKGRKLAGTAALIAALMGPTASMAQPVPSPAEVTAQPATGATANVNRAVKNVREQLVQRFGSESSSTAFLKFVREAHSPTFADMPDNQVKDYYNKKVLPTLLDVVKKVPVLNTVEHGDIIPPEVAAEFASDVQKGGLFHSDLEKLPPYGAIYINPQSFEATRQTDLKTITATVMEEFFHAVDGNVTAANLFPSLVGKPQADTQFAASKSLEQRLMSDIISPQARNQYVAVPQEFHAKLQVIKMQLQEKHPNFFEKDGSINKEALENVLSFPRMYFDSGEVDFRIFDVLQKNESEKIKQYIDQVVKAPAAAPASQMA